MKISQHAVVNCNIDVAILGGNTAGTAAKKFNGNLIVAQQELYPFISDDPSLMELVGLL